MLFIRSNVFLSQEGATSMNINWRFRRSSPSPVLDETECRIREMRRIESKATHWVVVSVGGVHANVEIVGISPTITKECGDFTLLVVDGRACISFEGRNEERVEIELAPGHDVRFECQSHSDGSRAGTCTFFCSFPTKEEAKKHAARHAAPPPPISSLSVGS